MVPVGSTGFIESPLLLFSFFPLVSLPLPAILFPLVLLS
jgi:hypothetical protein